MNYENKLYKGLSDNASRSICSKIAPVVSRLSKTTGGSLIKSGRYSRLTENITKSYLVGRLRDIKLKGRDEARRAIQKRITIKKQGNFSNIQAFVDKNLPIWSDFLYKTASNLDHEALVGFFVPFIYGGVLSAKNADKSFIYAISFDPDGKDKPTKERVTRAIEEMIRQKQRGITMFLLIGAQDEIYSQDLISLIINSPDRAFILIETDDRANEVGSVGEGAYKREVLSGLARAKNLMVVLDGAGESLRLRAKSRALSSYNVLHAFYGTDEEIRQGGALSGVSTIMLFSSNRSVLGEIDSILTILNGVGADFSNISPSMLPKRLLDYISSPRIPVPLPDLFELLIILQYIVSDRRIEHLEYKLV